MATKQAASHKTSSAAAKKPRVKASSAKTTTKKKSGTPSSAQAANQQSFRLSRETQSFISSRITLQTVYWSILAIVVLIVGLMILNAQLDILEMLDEISQNL